MNPLSESPIVGIDLGTTNSVVAAYLDGKVQVIEEDGDAILPSIVAMTMDGKLIVGKTAKNQLSVFPERTIASVKRKMGQAVKITMADQEYSPQEISAMILRRLKQRAEQALGREVTRAVITVPAFFDENQRQATREAGQLAGLTVERIINEPTAASLVYHAGDTKRRHLMVYDLGGGTFDVSIVRIEQGVVEVLSSKGDTQLGGDDFDQLLTKFVADAFQSKHNFDLMRQGTTRWRLIQACERAKCELSFVSNVRISEEFIATINDQPINLDMEISRHEYEGLIATLVDKTIECVDEAIRDSGIGLNQIDELILVGGSTRTPLVQNRLRDEFHRDPKWSVNPDLAVALGAATQAAMQQGYNVGPILIDVATHTLGIEALTGSPFNPELVFVPILRRNSPLPAKYEDSFRTMTREQQEVKIQVFQGESTQVHRNRLIGGFRLGGLNEAKNSDGEILIRFELTLDGILKVKAIERKTGKSQTLNIDNALAQMGEEVSENSNNRLRNLFGQSEGFQTFEVDREVDYDGDEEINPSVEGSSDRQDTQRIDLPHSKLTQLISRAKEIRSKVSGEDGDDIDRLVELLEDAELSGGHEMIPGLESELDDLLFYLAD